LSLRSDDLDSVSELYTENDFRQLVVTIETTPAFLGGLGKFEDHGKRGLVRKTSLGSHPANVLPQPSPEVLPLRRVAGRAALAGRDLVAVPAPPPADGLGEAAPPGRGVRSIQRLRSSAVPFAMRKGPMRPGVCCHSAVKQYSIMFELPAGRAEALQVNGSDCACGRQIFS
jgi:hypothetical protein